MSELGFNKIAAAVLATGLAVLGLRELSAAIYKPEVAAKPGYALQVAETTTSAAPVADLPPDWGTVLPAADVAAGQAQSQKCASCHNFTKGGPNGTGPDNWGVVGRQPGTHPGFAYSDAMVAFGKAHSAWTYDELYDFLKSPQSYVSGTKMTFIGLKTARGTDQSDRLAAPAVRQPRADSRAQARGGACASRFRRRPGGFGCSGRVGRPGRREVGSAGLRAGGTPWGRRRRRP